MDDLETELWLACVGPFVSLPPLNSIVIYWPQGHLEQVVACVGKFEAWEDLPHDEVPPKILCRLKAITFNADPKTDEGFVQFSLHPMIENDVPMDVLEAPPPLVPKNACKFSKILSASDISIHGGFSIPKKAAEECLPLLDHTMSIPCQELVAKDLHGVEWNFHHIYRGAPRRHMLTTGWGVFVNTKRLVAGDTIVFVRGENGQLRLGIRRAKIRYPKEHGYIISDDVMHLGVLAAASYAAQEMNMFTVIYYPRISPSEFIIPYCKYAKAQNNPLTMDSRFEMKIKSEGTLRRCIGTIIGNGDSDPMRWPNSAWRSVRLGGMKLVKGMKGSHLGRLNLLLQKVLYSHFL